MLVVFLMILALGLLGAIVVGLHKYQRRESASNVDRQSPLPPLDAGVVAKFSMVEDSIIIQTEISDEPVNDGPPAVHAAVHFEPDTDASAAVPRNWIQECNDFKNQGLYTEAQAVCENHFPQWGAFNLACTVLRANIRNDIKNNRDITALLQQLFRCAAFASFLHDKTSDLPALSPRQLKYLPVSAWQALEMPFDKIGYTELRLLGKADHRLIRETWGEPAHNMSARLYHRDSWLRLIKVYGETPAEQTF
jgi:hypothetical protein